MEIKATIPFKVYNEEDLMASYSSRRDLNEALEMYNCTCATPLDNEALEAVADYLSTYADYINGVWEGTEAPLNIDTIDEDDFIAIFIAADHHTL